MLRVALAALHLIALGIGLGSVIQRGVALRDTPTHDSLRRAFRADMMWGIAAGLWITTGLWRALAGTEKTLDYYLSNHVFLAKMGMLALILALEVRPMITLIKWRSALAGGGDPATLTQKDAGKIATVSHIQALLVVLMVIAAAAMARGYGAR
ncbi:MAG TPA: DUF2214 family protein [Gemmatimonadaceae bacterium]|nr:DUF2214 family protein [Gemmatimonadaceae bacterium]